MDIEKIDDVRRDFESTMLSEHSKRKRFFKSFANNAGIFTGVLLMFVVIIFVTNDVKFISPEQIAETGLDFVLLLFVSYSMYVNCSDSGMRLGLQNESYTEEISEFEKLKKHIIHNNIQSRLREFCGYYIDEELKSSRTTVLAVVGFSLDEYMEKYVGKDELQIKHDRTLTRAQKRAIIKANRIEPIRLTPEMIMKRGRGSGRRSPLGTTPEAKKGANFGYKFVSSLVISLVISLIVLEPVKEPTWMVVANCILKLITVAMNGFNGYRYGYENIVFDTTHYVADQTDLMQQAVQYAERDELKHLREEEE